MCGFVCITNLFGTALSVATPILRTVLSYDGYIFDTQWGITKNKYGYLYNIGLLKVNHTYNYISLLTIVAAGVIL